jgi:hypothetical protein
MHMPLEQVQQHHLQSLIDAKAAETLTIEYKRETYGANDDARAEFLAESPHSPTHRVVIWRLVLTPKMASLLS